MENVWLNEEPALWHKSTIIRQSILLFSGLNLWPLCNLEDNFYHDSNDYDDLLALLNSNTHANLMEKLIAGASPYFMQSERLTNYKSDAINDEDENYLNDNLFYTKAGYFMENLQQYSNAPMP